MYVPLCINLYTCKLYVCVYLYIHIYIVSYYSISFKLEYVQLWNQNENKKKTRNCLCCPVYPTMNIIKITTTKATSTTKNCYRKAERKPKIL